MNNLDSYDYYQHVIPKRKDIRLTNYKIETFYISSKDRDISKFPNKYDFTAEFPYTFNDITMLELVKLYTDLDEGKDDLMDNYTKNFYNFIVKFQLKNQYQNFYMKLGNNTDINDSSNSFNWSTDRILNLFNKLYLSTIDFQIDLKHSELCKDDNIHFKKPRLKLKISKDYNLYYFQCLFETKFIDNNLSLLEDQHLKNWFYQNKLESLYETLVIDHDIDTFNLLSTFSYEDLNTMLNNKFDNVIIKKLVKTIEDTKNYDRYDNFQIDYGFFGLDIQSKNNFLSILGFNDINYNKNSIYSKNIKVDLLVSQYICTNIEVIGLTLLYRDGNIEIVNDEYDNKIVLEQTKLKVIPEFNNGFFKLESINNNVVDYKINVKTKKISLDVISITIDKISDRYLYYQLISCLLSNDRANGIKIDFIDNDNSIGNLIMENFFESKKEQITCFYDLTYFNNISNRILGKDFNFETGFMGFKQEDSKLIIYWKILSTKYDIDYKNYKGGNRYFTPPLKSEQFFQKRIIFNLEDIYKIYSSFLNKKRINLINKATDYRINYWSHIYLNKDKCHEYKLDIVTKSKIKYQSYFFERRYHKNLITMNFMFSGFSGINTNNLDKINYLNLGRFLVLDIGELNNKYSNNKALNKCFIEIPLGNSRTIHFESTESNSIIYFNPIKKEISKLSIKFRDLDYNIVNNDFGSDYILVFNVKQLNNSGTLYGTS